jgi:hypothetical protein
MALGSAQPLTEMSTRNISWGVKAARTTFMCRLSTNLEASISWKPKRLSRPLKGLLYLYLLLQPYFIKHCPFFWVMPNIHDVSGADYSYLQFLMLYHSHPRSVTPRSRTFLEKLIVPQLVKKLPVFYGTRRFITAFTTAGHLSISTARSFHFTPLTLFLEDPF